MNTPCIGIFGKLLGHKFEATYHTTSTPHYDNTREVREVNENYVKALELILGNTMYSDTADVVSALTGSQSEVEFATTETYRGHVCLRCGLVVNQQTLTLNLNK